MGYRFGLGLLLATAVAAGAGFATVALARSGHLPVPSPDLLSKIGGPKPVTVYLHRHGGQLSAGPDSPQQGRSSIVEQQGKAAAQLSAFRGSDKRWNALTQCVRGLYADFNVNIVDERPTNGRYMLAMVGGSPRALGLPRTVGGVAPHGHKVVSDAVLFVFQTSTTTARSLCETTAHEIGHAIGLDHSRLCSDLMSYQSCGPKAFRDRLSACGEWKDRTCEDGRRTQNSWRELAAAVGLRRKTSGETTARPKTPNGDAAQLEVRVTSDPQAGKTYVVEVHARHPLGIRHLDLFWYANRGYRLRCDGRKGPIPFRCSKSGDIYRFELPVGAGKRKFFSRITDGRGKTKRSRTYQETFRRR